MRDFRYNSQRRRPRGFTMVEFIVAIVVLGIAMSGLFPLLVMQYRTLQRLIIQTGCQNESYYNTPHSADASLNWEMNELYVTPYIYLHNHQAGWIPWARKLGASALLTTDPIADAYIPPNPILEIQASSSFSENYREPDGGWTSKNSTERIHAKHTEDQKEPAVWKFTDVPPGYYYLKATWTADTVDPTNQTINAIHYVYDASTLETENAYGNQQVDYNNGQLTGGPWLLTGGNVSVYLYAQIDSAVVAGKLKLVPKNSYTLNAAPSCAKTTITEDGKTVNAWSAAVTLTKQ